jgi:hypothetical protein
MSTVNSTIANVGVGSGSDPRQFEFSPFKLKASNSTSPLENWNLTALSKSTAAPSSFLHVVLDFKQI